MYSYFWGQNIPVAMSKMLLAIQLANATESILCAKSHCKRSVNKIKLCLHRNFMLVKPG